MYQAGIKNITLYENLGINFNRYDPLADHSITDLITLGSIIEIENLQQPQFDISLSIGKQGKLNYLYDVKFFILDLSQASLIQIEQLTQSIYGWCFLVEFYDGTFKFYNTPVYCNQENKIEPQTEMTFSIEMKSASPTEEKHFDYTPFVSTVPIYRADTTLITADSTIYTADYAL